MTSKTPVTPPARFASPSAVGYTDANGDLSLVTSASPLPTYVAKVAGAAPMAGQASTTALIGPFTPAPGLPVHLLLTGTWTGTISIERSIDDGASRQPLTAGGMPWGRFSVNANEVVWQETDPAAQLYLNATLTAGTVSYRVSQ